uniref:Caerin-1.7 n=2 Tax=Pelodryadinae TaxID=192733 RepID=CR17_RANCH|nr:RecName: Full=Caerin-1.7; Contains: RecName: Full=Caerin-1.7.1 [Litoria xanthomera]P62549.2 RecName: Full=Caerin-1.7; Contains: RecName: Full=Caerin-1.7.1 [Ranoidea chloris]
GLFKVLGSVAKHLLPHVAPVIAEKL